MTDKQPTSLEELMQGDAYKQTEMAFELPEEQDLKTLTDLVALHELLSREVENLEAKLKQVKSKLHQVSTVDIPEVFQEMGNIGEIKLLDGRSVKVSSDISVSMKKDNLSENDCFKFLDENQLSSIIKSQFSIAYGKDQQDKVDETRNTLLESNLDFSEKRNVHPSTLKASVKGLLEQGVQIPDSFNFFQYKKTVIK